MSKEQNTPPVSPEDERKENLEVARAEAEGDRPDPPTDPKAAPPDPPDKPAAPKSPPRFADEKRKDIYANARRSREDSKPKDFDALDEPGKIKAVRMEMQMAGKSEEEIAARLTELNLAEAPLEPAKPEKKPDKGLDKDKKTDTIRVDGEDIEVSVDELIEVGKKTKQKQVNADRRQQELSRYEQSLKDYERRLRENAARGLDANGNPLAPAKADLPDKGVGDAMQGAKEAIAKARTAVFSGDEDGFEEAMTELLTSAVQGRTSPTPPLDELVERTADTVESRQEQKQRTSKAQTVNETFEKDYADLFEDDQKFELTKAEFSRLRKAEPDADPVAHMRSAGETIRKLFKPDSQVDDELERRRADKARKPQPPTASGRVPTPPVTQPPSRSEVVAEMRRKRGLP